MRSTLVLSILLTIIASIEGSCEECLNIFTAYQEGVMSDESLADQSLFASQAVCPNEDAYDECHELIFCYWPTLAQALYPVFLQPERVCSIVLGACKYSTDEITSEECQSWLDTLADNMVQDDSIAERIDFLKGEQYCNEEEECIDFIDAYFKHIHEVLASAIIERSETTCCDISDNGVCC